MLFRLDKAGKEFSGRWLFRDVSVQCNSGDCVGLIGRNGTGKTTLLNLIDGRMTPDEGQVTRSSQITISRIEQISVLDPKQLVYETVIQVFDDLKQMERDLRELQLEISGEHGEIEKNKAEEYERLQSHFAFYGGYDFESRTEKVLFGLGFSAEELQAPCGHLSGGQQSRLLLAGALLRPAELLLLDEPTNHLDLDGIIWLTNYLQASRAALVLISHDREFLDTVTSSTWELEAGTLFHYSANYSASRELRQQRNRLKQQEYQQQREWKRKTEDFIRRNIVGQKTKQAQARRKQLEKTVWLPPPVVDKAAPQIGIPEARRGGALSFELVNAAIGYKSQVLIKNVTLRLMRGERIGILGSNGSGKTTLIKTLLGKINTLEGTVTWGDNNVPAYFAQETGPINQKDTVLEHLAHMNPTWSDLEIRTFAAAFLFQADDVHKPVQILSGGEISRLYLARLFSRPSNVLLLDEPTNHLDIRSRESLEKALNRFTGTLLVVSHDLYFLRSVVDRYYLIREGTLRTFDRMEDLRAELFTPLIQMPKAKAKSGKLKTDPGLSKNERMRREQRLRQLEDEIEDLEKEKAEIQNRLQQGLQDHLLLQRLALRHEEIENQLTELLEAWAQIAAELQEG